MSIKLTLNFDPPLTQEEFDRLKEVLKNTSFSMSAPIPFSQFAERESSAQSIEAANNWYESLALPDFIPSTSEVSEKLHGPGYFCDKRGASAGTIYAFFMRDPENTWKSTDTVDWPEDDADFARCHNLLTQVPEWRERILEMSVLCKEWAFLASHWSEVEAAHIAGDSALVKKLIESGVSQDC